MGKPAAIQMVPYSIQRDRLVYSVYCLKLGLLLKLRDILRYSHHTLLILLRGSLTVSVSILNIERNSLLSKDACKSSLGDLAFQL